MHRGYVVVDSGEVNNSTLIKSIESRVIWKQPAVNRGAQSPSWLGPRLRARAFRRLPVGPTAVVSGQPPPAESWRGLLRVALSLHALSPFLLLGV